MMAFLINDVGGHGLHSGFADGKGPVAVLPIKIGILWSLRLYPSRGILFNDLHQFDDRDVFIQRKEGVDMIGGPANAK